MNTLHQKPALQAKSQPFSGQLDSFLQNSRPGRLGQGFAPAVDLWETQTNYQLEIALPGLKKEDLTVEFQEGVLTISGNRAFQKGEEQRKYHRVENLYGAFKRAFKLPEHVDAAAIEAQFENGVLQISVPKVAEMVMKRQITIK